MLRLFLKFLKINVIELISQSRKANDKVYSEALENQCG